MTGLVDRRGVLTGAGALGLAWWARPALAARQTADLILTNGRFLTMNDRQPRAAALAVKDGLVLAVGSARSVMALAGSDTRVVDLAGRTAIPGINDSHTHLIRGGLHYNLELRWDGVPSLGQAMRMLRDQARRTPPPQWVQVVGGFSAHQFAERRLPTLDEINQATGDTPAFILSVYDRAFLNRAALRAIGWTKDTAAPPGGEIQRDARGNPTGVVIAKPGPRILLQTLALAPRLSFDDELNSTRQFMAEYNRLGVTSIADAGGGFQRFPDDYRVIEELHRRGLVTLRIAYNLFTQERGRELEDLTRWGSLRRQSEGDALYRMNGAGENLVASAADFENFVEARPGLGASMEAELEAAVKRVIDNGWSFRLHATYGESIERFLNVFERVDAGGRDLNNLGWILDHAETITPRQIERVGALGGQIAVQHRMSFVGEEFVARYGREAAEHAPPLARIMAAGVPLMTGSDGTRASGYNPWVTFHWLVTGRTLGGLRLAAPANRLSREKALRLMTREGARVSRESQVKGRLAVGQYADIAILAQDPLTAPEEELAVMEADLTLLGGKPVYASSAFRSLAPAPLPVSPDWSPVGVYGGAWRRDHGHLVPTAAALDYVPVATVANSSASLLRGQGRHCPLHGVGAPKGAASLSCLCAWV